MIHLGFDIDDLVILKLLLTEPTITGVAKIIRLSQEAISQRLREMSKSLRYKIHVRHGRGMILTDKGRKLGESAKAALDILEGLNLEPDSIIETPKPTVPVVHVEPDVKKALETPFKLSGRSMCFSYMNKK